MRIKIQFAIRRFIFHAYRQPVPGYRYPKKISFSDTRHCPILQSDLLSRERIKLILADSLYEAIRLRERRGL